MVCHNGPDEPENILVLCPNHHANFAYGRLIVNAAEYAGRKSASCSKVPHYYLGYWGYQSAEGPLLKFALGPGMPLLVTVLRDGFGLPAASYRLGEWSRLLLEIVILGGATLAIYDPGRVIPALDYCCTVIVDY